jgi:uncharacterized protein (TIGR02145 family)
VTDAPLEPAAAPAPDSAAGSSSTAAATISASDEGVKINGITWATRNVGVKGTFMDNPSDNGLYYNFEEAQTVCPEGWRIPTKQEFDVLAQAADSWPALDGKSGCLFRSGDNAIFIPAAGYRPSTDGPLYWDGEIGWCWSSDTGRDHFDGSPVGFNLEFSVNSSRTEVKELVKIFYLPVRCVRE